MGKEQGMEKGIKTRISTFLVLYIHYVTNRLRKLIAKIRVSMDACKCEYVGHMLKAIHWRQLSECGKKLFYLEMPGQMFSNIPECFSERNDTKKFIRVTCSNMLLS